MSTTPSLSSSVSTQSGIVSPSVSKDFEVANKGSEPQAISSTSNCPSPSSSVSALFPVPSASVSNHSLASNGKASFSSN